MKQAVLATALAALGALSATAAHAGDAYASIGLPGLTLGYAHALTPSIGLRADITTIGHPSIDREVDGIRYQGAAKADRLALLADWFFAGSARVTAGATFQKTRMDVVSRPTTGTIQIGDTNYAVGAGDRIDANVRFPNAMPYLGIGWGHRPDGKGLGFVADIGLSIGKAKVNGQASGPLLSNAVSQQDLDKELNALRDGLAKVRGIPQVSIGLSYAF